MTNQVYRGILEPGNDNSDVSEVDADDLAKMVKGIDDIDDALFGFKTKTNDSQIKSQLASSEPKPLERSVKKPVITSKHLDDMPDGDLLADISLSDEDFYDLGKSSPLSSKKEVKKPESPKITGSDKLAKTKKIADLFGLDDEEESKTVNKKKNDNAADWLGIKSSPLKKAANKQEPRSVQVDLTDVKPNSGNISIEPKKEKLVDPFPKQSSFTSNLKDNEPTTAIPKANFEFKREQITSRPKTGEIFDLLVDGREIKSTESHKDKKSGIFEELFGDSNITKTKTSRKNSLVKTPEPVNIESLVPDESTVQLGEYKPSSTSARRPGLGRRRDISTPSTAQTPATFLFQEDWLETSLTNDKKKEIQQTNPDAEIQLNEGLPTWLGGSSLPKASKAQVNVPAIEIKEPEEKLKLKSETNLVSERDLKPEGVLMTNSNSGDQVVESLKQTLTTAVENDQHTVLAFQRTEAQLLSALELQTTQNDLSAVCARQQSLLQHQEQQLAQLVKRQTNRQADTEKQLLAQQNKIKQLLEVLTMNLPPEVLNSTSQNSVPLKKSNEKELQEHLDGTDFKVELQHITLEKEELRLRIKLMEKHYKMEFESIQVQHRREIESWEDQLARQKDLSEQLVSEFKERIKQLKENEADLIVQHKERVERLKQERMEDVNQLMEFHKASLQQLSILGKIVLPSTRDEQKPKEINWRPLNDVELSEKEKDLLKKEKYLNELKEKIDSRENTLEKEIDDLEKRVEQEKIKSEETARQLKHEQSKIRYKEKQLESERRYLDEQNLIQRKDLEEMQEKIMQERTKLAAEQLAVAEERAKLEALAKLQGVSGSSTFDFLKAKAEVHGALEIARDAELQANEERKRLREKERSLDNYRWKLKEMEEDLVARVEHVDRLMQVSEANQEMGQKALEEAKQLEKKAEEKMMEVERRRSEIKDKEQNLIRLKLEMAQEEIRINRKRQHLEHILPALSSEETLTLQPVRDVIDPKMLIMRLRAEREFEVTSKSNQVTCHTIENNQQL